MRKVSKVSLDIRANIDKARDDLLALARQLADWRRVNEAAARHLKTAANWEGSKPDNRP